MVCEVKLGVNFALIYTASSSYRFLPLLIINMAAGITTRGALRAFKERIQDEDIVIIPANILTTLLESTVNNHEALAQSHNRIGCALEQLALNLQQMQYANQGGGFNTLLEKMDILTSTIADSNTPQDASRATNAEIEEILHTYMKTEEKMLESRDLASYYEELLQKDYVPWKFRAEITPTTPEYEKPIYADGTKERFRNQILLLQTRTQHLNRQLEQLNIEIEAVKRTLQPSKQEKLTNKMRANTERTRQKWTRSMNTIKGNYELDMISGDTQFMVKVTTKNYPVNKPINTRLNPRKY